MYGFLLIVGFGLRICGAIVCSSKAESLNRNQALWAFLGFISPILFMIWIQFMKPRILWEESKNSQE